VTPTECTRKRIRTQSGAAVAAPPWFFFNSSVISTGNAFTRRERRMEFYLSFHELLGRGGNSLALIFLPLFLVMTVLEGLIILYRQGAYPWKNAGVSLLVTVGHFITQAAVHGLIFGIIAAFVYKFRLTTIPVIPQLDQPDRSVLARRPRLLCRASLLPPHSFSLAFAQRSSQQRQDAGDDRFSPLLDADPVRRTSVLLADRLDRI
jgi:hypothetical protein